MWIPRLLFGLVLASAALLLVAGFLPEPPGAGAAPHPEYPALLVGGDGARDPVVLCIGWAFGSVQIAFFGACFALGLRRRGALGPIGKPLIVGIAVYEALWSALVVSYAVTSGDPEARLWASFPAPTAWMLYALWPFPLWFAWLYIHHFKDWILNEDELERFRSRLAELEAAQTPDEGAS